MFGQRPRLGLEENPVVHVAGSPAAASLHVRDALFDRCEVRLNGFDIDRKPHGIRLELLVRSVPRQRRPRHRRAVEFVQYLRRERLAVFADLVLVALGRASAQGIDLLAGQAADLHVPGDEFAAGHRMHKQRELLVRHPAVA